MYFNVPTMRSNDIVVKKDTDISWQIAYLEIFNSFDSEKRKIPKEVIVLPKEFWM